MTRSKTAIPVVEEALHLDKKEVATGTIRVETVTHNVQEIVKADLKASSVEVTRVPVGREIDAIPDVRVEGDVTVIPVVEERLVIQKRLFLKEELRLTHSTSSESVEIPVELRKQRVEVTREPATPTNSKEREQ